MKSTLSSHLADNGCGGLQLQTNAFGPMLIACTTWPKMQAIALMRMRTYIYACMRTCNPHIKRTTPNADLVCKRLDFAHLALLGDLVSPMKFMSNLTRGWFNDQIGSRRWGREVIVFVWGLGI